MIFDKLSVKKLYDDLDYWQMIGIADDIIDLPEHRPEYSHLVSKYKNLENREIIAKVKDDLFHEMHLPFVQQRTFWKLLVLQFKKLLRII